MERNVRPLRFWRLEEGPRVRALREAPRFVLLAVRVAVAVPVPVMVAVAVDVVAHGNAAMAQTSAPQLRS